MKKTELMVLLSSELIGYYHGKLASVIKEITGKKISPEIIKKILDPLITQLKKKINDENALSLIDDGLKEFCDYGETWLEKSRHMAFELKGGGGDKDYEGLFEKTLNINNAGMVLIGYANYCMAKIGTDFSMYFEDLVNKNYYT